MKLLALVVGAAAAFAIGVILVGVVLPDRSPGRSSQCYDASVRFPEAVNPQAALDEALRAVGMNPYAAGDPAVQTIRSDKAVLDLRTSLWVADTLWAQRTGHATRSLAEALQEPLASQSYLTPPTSIPAWTWAEIASWPPDSCEGAFIRNPRNASLIAPLARLPRTQ
jgi:hypothetical protein